MAAPNVQIQEIDLSTRVPSFPGVAAGIVIPALKGPVNERVLCTSETQFLRSFTPDERIDVGMDNSYFSALAYLQKSNKLWVVRAAPDDALYGGVVVKTGVSSGSNYQLVSGLTDPEGFPFESDDCILFYGSNPGAWNNDIFIELTTYDENPDYVKEDGAFIVNVFKAGNLNTPVESWTCSRNPGHRDGFGRNIYVEEVLSGSEYVRAIDNIAIDSAVDPKDQDTPLQFAQGDNGSAVTDGKMMIALDKLSNQEEVFVTLIMDGGWATVPYQQAIISLCESRKDCFGILSTPYEAEANANYINEILDYRKTVLNANTSFAALYTPHVKIYDKHNDRSLFVSPDGYCAAAMSETASNYAMWYPPTGWRRGIINVIDTRRRFSKGEMDTLYDQGVNPIRFAPGRGIPIWGQKTLYARPSALDRINVRMLLIQIEPAIAYALEDFIFELNNAATRSMVRVIIDSYMKGIMAANGVLDYYIVCNDTNNTPSDIDNHILNVWLFVKPALSIEYIKFTTVITSTGLDFGLAAQAL